MTVARGNFALSWRRYCPLRAPAAAKHACADSHVDTSPAPSIGGAAAAPPCGAAPRCISGRSDQQQPPCRIGHFTIRRVHSYRRSGRSARRRRAGVQRRRAPPMLALQCVARIGARARVAVRGTAARCAEGVCALEVSVAALERVAQRGPSQGRREGPRGDCQPHGKACGALRAPR